MKILHIKNTANVGRILADEQRKLGHDSKVFDFYDSPLGFELDYSLHLNHSQPKIFKFSKLVNSFFSNRFYDYDIYHCHMGYSFVPENFDLYLFKLLKKKIILHYHGDDIRGRGERFMLKHLNIKSKIVSTPDLLKDVPDAEWIPNPLNITYLDSISKQSLNGKIKKNNEGITILHAPSPSGRHRKGTEYVLKAIKELSSNYKINFVLLENVSNIQVLKTCASADIILDQFITGWYGIFSLEALAFKKPVIVYINKDLEQYLPFNPFVNSTKEEIKDKLMMLIEDFKLRKSLGNLGRRFVEKFHNVQKITKKIIEKYEN